VSELFRATIVERVFAGKGSEVELDELLGEHVLTGVDRGTEQIEDESWRDRWRHGPAETLRFVLDGITFQATENPDDGYRSSMGTLAVTAEPVQNIFQPVRVLAQRRADSDYEKNDVIEFVDVATNKLVLAVGTGNTRDYYPYFVGEFDPTAMVINNQ
jgi:hypothetical protein